MLEPLLRGWRHTRLCVHSQTLRNPIDIVKETNHLNCDRDLLVGEIVVPQTLEVRGFDFVRRQRQLYGVITQSAVLAG